MDPSMAAAAEQSLLQPLIHRQTEEGDQATRAPSSDSGILLRLLSVILIGAVALWANQEASKGFGVIIINDAKDSSLGRKFELFYQSDDKASRILLNTSSFVERFLYDGFPLRHRKPVSQVTIHFSGNNSITAPRIPVTSGPSLGQYIISLSSSVMEERDHDEIITWTLRRAMVRIWLWGDEMRAPPQLVEGMAEHIAAVAVGDVDSSQPLDLMPVRGPQDWWKDKDPEFVAKLLGYCESLGEGFIRRLNQRMRSHLWDDRTVDMAFGNRKESACDSDREKTRGLRDMT